MSLARAVRTIGLILCLSGCGKVDGPGLFDGKVTGIKDGDTFEVLIDGSAEVVRLAHIDCPERSQPFGKAAKQFASDLCFGKEVTVATDGKRDRYKRLIGVIHLTDGVVVNKELVREGLAWHFIKYSKDKSYDVLEGIARVERKGLWADSIRVPPWEWRKSKPK
ncbi:MAG: thermonuclease family protein [Flavobacteriales bacterium]|nr:thermonuclease family protein [Flavobacteriales bacterium]MCC6937160.1 thermonuclease family protein [Flavobacteriales bacterium]